MIIDSYEEYFDGEIKENETNKEYNDSLFEKDEIMGDKYWNESDLSKTSIEDFEGQSEKRKTSNFKHTNKEKLYHRVR